MSSEVDTKLVVPALAPVYRGLGQFTNPFLRIVCALILVPDGWTKLTNPQFAADVTGLIAKLGFLDPMAWFWFIALLEFAGGIALALGFLTRLLGAMLTIEMLVIAFGLHWPAGRSISFDILLAAVAFALTLRGGGRWSLDRLIGRVF